MDISKFIESLSETEKIELQKYFTSHLTDRVSVPDFVHLHKSKLSVRAINGLFSENKYYGIKYMDEFSKNTFLKIRDIGRKTADEVVDILNENNYKYKDK